MNSMLRDATAFMAHLSPVELPSAAYRAGKRQCRLFLHHSSLAQASEIRGFEQGADLRHPEITDGLQSGDTRISIVVAQPAGFGEFGGSRFGLASEGIGGREVGVNVGAFRHSDARLFLPEDRLVGARLQQMHEPNL